MTSMFRRLAVALTAGALLIGALAGPAAGHALKGAPKADRKIHAREHVQIAKARKAARIKIARVKASKAKPARVKAAKARINRTKAVRIKAAKVRAAKARAAAAKARKAARFVVTGTVVDGGVDPVAGTLLVAVTGGYRQYHGSTQLITLAPGAKVTVDDAAASLADVVDGSTVMARGASAGMLAIHVSATSPPVVEDPVEDPVDETLDETIIQ